MEAGLRGKGHDFYGPVVSDLNAAGKKNLEWDLNDWRWDGDLFVASRLNSLPSDCSSKQFFPIGPELPVNVGDSGNFSSCTGEAYLGNDSGKLEKRRRAVMAEDGAVRDEFGFLNLKLGSQVYPGEDGDGDKWEEKSGKKTKIGESTSSRSVCQVDDCRADLSGAKDYHRRHKVCDVHSKASRALVGNVMQRFCQQCSRFHNLQEFDDGKRSCRRRLAGHNRRRRKTHPDAVVNGSSLNDERGGSYLLISLLRILSNMHSSSSEQTKDQDLLTHLLRNLANLAGTINERNLPGILQKSQELLNAGTSVGASEKGTEFTSNGVGYAKAFGSASKLDVCADTQEASESMQQCIAVPASELVQGNVSIENAEGEPLQNLHSSQSKVLFPTRDKLAAKPINEENKLGRINLKCIDLNNVYNDSLDCAEYLERSYAATNPRTLSGDCPSWLQQPHRSSPPQTSGNSGSASSLSLSSSSGEAQCRTDRIVFKLFGKDPNDFPHFLRAKILEWLSHSPTDIESYIKPGCVILTVYLRMDNSKWEELCCDLGSSLSRLLNTSSDMFWRSGWAYVRLQHCVSFIYNGQVVLDTPLPVRRDQNCRISSIKPVAVPPSDKAHFEVKGYNLTRPTTRLLCALEGQYLVQETCYDLRKPVENFTENDELECLRFSCSTPDFTGRGFIEVEENGLSSSFFPFIVVEQDVCSEICTLESVINVAETNDEKQGENQINLRKNQALYFLHEMGWLLHRSRVRFRLGSMDPYLDLFPFNRFNWLIEFSINCDWCAVVNKLLDVIYSGTVDVGQHSSVEPALMSMDLLHKAVKRNRRSMVEFLLSYLPNLLLDKPQAEYKHLVVGGLKSFLFKPNAVGPGGLTPLHIAASKDDSDDVLDALTNDPGQVGIEAWKSAHDNAGLTPFDYACQRGHHSYIHLVQEKINKRSKSGHVVLNIPGALLDCSVKEKASSEHTSEKAAGLQTRQIEMKIMQQHCHLCRQNLAHGRSRTVLAYRPATLSMVAIAAVCVCVALLWRSLPAYWPRIHYGSS